VRYQFTHLLEESVKPVAASIIGVTTT